MLVKEVQDTVLLTSWQLMAATLSWQVHNCDFSESIGTQYWQEQFSEDFMHGLVNISGYIPYVFFMNMEDEHNLRCCEILKRYRHP